jgi:Heterokaryon incompatibility protein (HET)
LTGAAQAWDTLATAREISTSFGAKECLELAKKWMTDCVNLHRDCTRKSPSRSPRRIVDIGSDNTKMRLLEDEVVYGPYAALSHCWGTTHPLDTTLYTLNCRKQKLEWTSMPATFRDAITVTRELGLRYLWIDSLCIIQDDDRDWELESAKMGSIYEGAHIVIAASMSTGPDHSFLAPRRIMFTDFLELNYQRKDGSVCLVKARPVVELNKSIDPLDRRAWTFQEQRRAVRLLRYSATELQWDCRTKSTCECESVHLKGFDLDIIYGRYCVPEVDSSSEMLFHNWQTMLQPYTRRRLTRKSDILPAISGIAAHVHEKTSSCYLAGLWKDNLPSDLLWKVSATLRDGIRTFSGDIFGFSLLRTMPTYRAPTFSWASIDSEVEKSRGNFNTDSQIDAVILDAQCTLKGTNPFGEVTDGHIILESAVVQADVTVRYGDDAESGSEHMGLFNLTHNGMTTYMTADLPLVECLAWAESGVRERTMRRASVDDDLKSVTGSVFCVALYHNVNSTQAALVLGRSPKVRGAYERLGVMTFDSSYSNCDEERFELLAEAWFADAERCVVKIV